MNIKRKNFKMVFYIIAFVLSAGIIGYLTSSESFVMDIVTTIGTVIGMFFLYLEFRRSRNIEEANFISNLNSQFNNDTQIQKVYLKVNGMLPREIHKYYKMTTDQKEDHLYLTTDEISASVSFFTFFETIFILTKKKIISLEMIDDLFSGRFFQLTNDPAIQDLKLVKNKRFYANIFELHKIWLEYRIANNKAFLLHKTSLSDYYDLDVNGYEYKPLTINSLEEFVLLQDLVHSTLKNPELFSTIDIDVVVDVINDEKSKCYAIVREDEKALVGAGILTTTEFCNANFYRKFLDMYDEKAIFYIKTMMVNPAHRGLNMQQEMIRKMLQDARFMKARLVILVVHELNSHSIDNFEKTGFKYHSKISLGDDFERNIMITKLD